MSDNDLKTLPPEVYALRSLKTLHVSACHIHRTLGMEEMTLLAQLFLDHNDLEDGQLRPLPLSLQRLDLSVNHFGSFPPVLQSLRSLVELDLSGNRIAFMTGIGALVGLVVLQLNNNVLVEVSEDAKYLTQLKKISLRNNLIGPKAVTFEGASIPRSFFAETGVETIDLAGNTQLTTTLVMTFDGVDVFMARRQLNKEKSISGGALTSTSLFGLQ